MSWDLRWQKARHTCFKYALSEEERRFIKSLAATQGMTHQEAVVAAFTAWAQQLGASGSPVAPRPAPADDTRGTAPQQASPTWLQKAAKLDWTKCPEVEVMQGKDRRLWVLQGTLAPLTEVLQAAAGGNPAEELAEVFAVKPAQLAKVLKFAGAPVNN